MAGVSQDASGAADPAGAPGAARAPRARRQRGARESLASIVLGFESIIVFLGGLALYGLKALPAGIEQWWGIVVGVVLAILLIATSGVLRHDWGIALGWFWQLLIIAGGFLEPALAVVGLIFGAMYAYATIKGGSLDRRNAARAATNGD
ncbi:DUF4233 domain-containing protein [Microbacterium lacticum]|uniref:DUF4233 domain-containing protein n=1 Tax=Microbacterium lacticum TaxID=33885 RepID=UPI0027D93A8E|nr:DUF4233 domain-containing protein [Microbacterium lacticum]